MFYKDIYGMKVLFVINSSNNGGAQKMIVTLYKSLLHIFPKSKIVFLLKIDSPYSNIDGAYYLSERLSTLKDYITVYKKLREVFKEEAPNATISFLPLSNIFSSVIGKISGVEKRIVSQRNPPQSYGFIVRELDRLLGSFGFYTHNVCNSQAGKDAFINYSKSYKKKLSTIMNCVEPADYSITKEDARISLSIPMHKKVIVCVARLHEQKNHKLLIDSMKYLDKDVVLYCAGDGPLREQILLQIENNKLLKNVVLLGDLSRSKVKLLFRSSDIFVTSSIYEGLSNSLIEAMTYGLPIVFSNIPSYTNFLKLKDNKYAGLLIDSKDEKKWASCIDELLKNNRLMNHYSNCSLEKVSNLTSKNMTLNFVKLLKLEI